ncbi:YaiI/YqxD family protein [bacterium]|nr:YaiI/YqxD family protein [bacterium]
MLDIYIDADGCPVKEEVYRVAARYKLKVFVVANIPIRVPPTESIEGVVVKGGMNVADDWIADHIDAGDICITTDIPLADRCLSKKAAVLKPNGHPLTEKSIGNALANRELLQGLRQMGEITGGPAPFKPADRSRFLSSLDQIIQSLIRAKNRG